MSENDWWSDYGPFQQWNRCPSRPDPVEVLHFSLERQGIKPEKHAASLMKLLDLHQTMVYDILKGETLDSISRCRQLVQTLKIYPPLLGIDAKFYPIEQHACWWHTYGFSFHADAQGYPMVSEVIAGLRMQRTQMEGGRVKVWSQEDLGDAVGLKKETIHRMEHEKNPQILDSMSRRAMLASALGTLAADKEPTLFRLFGLDPRAYGMPVPAHEAVPMVQLSTKKLTNETLNEYHREQAAFFSDYFTRHGEDAVAEALGRAKQLQAVLPLANTTAQRVNILALQCRYHQLLLNVAHEQQRANVITFHGNEAVKLAEYAASLPELGEKALLGMSNELLASALERRALAHYELGQYDLAQRDIDKALLLPLPPSSQVKANTLLDAGVIHAHMVRSAMDRTLVLSYFKLAAQVLAPIPTSDDNFMRCDNSMLYIRKAMALSSPNMKGATAEKVSDILEDAQRLTDPELIRRQVVIDVFQAQAYFDAGEYQQATDIALQALDGSRRIRSHLNRNRIEELYRKLLDTSFRDKPILAYLGMRLRTWDYGMR
jgi:tetratricopeptide (TPR) repeat protein/DNA-binding XRE family transcriptional regulator